MKEKEVSSPDSPVGKPITPDEVAGAKAALFPAAVFDAFNAEIAAEYADGRATVKQKAVVARMLAAGLAEVEIDRKGYLNVEDVYRAAGWTVVYDKPGFNETYDATFEFKAKRR